jgi:putative ABC transport system substrate-binding protein
VFVVGLDPVAAGLVASFNRPGGNATGMATITGPLGQKRLEILRELVPKLKVVPMLVNPISPDTVPEIRDVLAAAQAMGLELRVVNATTLNELDAASRAFAQAIYCICSRPLMARSVGAGSARFWLLWDG